MHVRIKVTLILGFFFYLVQALFLRDKRFCINDVDHRVNFFLDLNTIETNLLIISLIIKLKCAHLALEDSMPLIYIANQLSCSQHIKK